MSRNNENKISENTHLHMQSNESPPPLERSLSEILLERTPSETEQEEPMDTEAVLEHLMDLEEDPVSPVAKKMRQANEEPEAGSTSEMTESGVQSDSRTSSRAPSPAASEVQNPVHNPKEAKEEPTAGSTSEMTESRVQSDFRASSRASGTATSEIEILIPDSENKAKEVSTAGSTSEMTESRVQSDSGASSRAPGPAVLTISASEPDLVLPERKLPKNLVEKEHHPWENNYNKDLGHVPKNVAKAIAASATIEDVQEFRNKSVQWARAVTPSGGPTLKGRFVEEMKTIKSRPQTPGVIYILKSSNGNLWLATPLNLEVSHPDRPDLHGAYLSTFSEDLLNGTQLHHNNFVLGDAVYVTEMRPRPKRETEDIATHWKDVHAKETKGFWDISKFYILERTYKDALTSRMPHNKKNSKNTMVTASGVNVPISVRIELYHAAKIPNVPNAKARGRIYLPSLQPGQPLSSIIPGKPRNMVLARTCDKETFTTVYPSVLSFQHVSAEEAESLRHPDVFKDWTPQKPDPLRAMIRSTFLAFSGTLAVANQDKDLQPKVTIVDNVSWVRGRPVVSCDIRSLYGQPHPEKWTRGTKLVMETADRPFDVEIESSTPDLGKITLTLRPMSSKPTVGDSARNWKGQQVILAQQLENNKRSFQTFPLVRDFQEMRKDAPIRLLLEAVLGGNKIARQEVRDQEVKVALEGCPLTAEQKNYVNGFVRSNHPAVVADSPFGTGKTYLIIVALRLAALELEKDKLHMATAVTNGAVAALVSTFLKFPEDKKIRALRVISPSNHDQIEEKVRTPIDYPTLAISTLLDYVKKVDSETGEDRVPCHLARTAVQHLVRDNASALDGWCPKNKELQSVFQTKEEPSSSCWSTFLRIYKPNVLFGTAASMIEFLYDGPLKNHRNTIITNQIDEASQFPMHQLITLGSLCPNARYALIGDVRQLAPYAHTGLSNEFKKIAVGALLESAAKSIPVFSIMTVRRCPQKLTQVCSDLFYGGKLKSARSSTESNPYTECLGIESKFPIQIITTEGEDQLAGTSRLNVEEAGIAAAIVKKIQGAHPSKTVAVLTFYKAQCGHLSRMDALNNSFVGTIDASQGLEFDVTIVLTTKSSDFNSKDAREDQTSFVEDVRRINVALSRAKGQVFVLLNRKAAETSKIWNLFFRKVPKGSTHQGSRFVQH
ncbi:hypothetical protein CRE_23593 [Caenorhabditis remanei]|uniref:DNA2/NAM7 helicase-like C-terminal domain-containing protein n=1 Tax=Caenorhabditis remanei TaxID=31234 RepID=E3MVQ6_CAERE|nr:hypothetical protein CRE_23593 [Caenorhabditis remanei]